MKYWKAIMAATLLLGLSACGGGDSSDKNDPPPSASTPPGVTIEEPVYNEDAAGTAEEPMMTVNFTVNDASGPVTGLQLGGTTLVQLIEDDVPANGTGGGLQTRWQSMFNKWRNRPTKFESTPLPVGKVVQASTNDKSNYAFVDNGDGSYTLKLFKIPFSPTGDINEDPVSGKPLVFDPSRTSRIGFQFTDASGVAIKANPTYDWVPNGGTVHTRDMADTETNCYSCHDQNTLALHGGKRFEVKYCVTCHNPGTTGYGESYWNGAKETTFSLNMSQMIHKIHRGKDLPSVNGDTTGTPGADGAQFLIFGKDDSKHQYAYNEANGKADAGHGVFYPQDTRNCSTCHSDSNPATPDAKNWHEKPDGRACGSCHDMKKGHYDTKDAPKCTTCHVKELTTDPGKYKQDTRNVHEGRVAALKAGAATLQIEVEHASYSAGQAKVDVRVLKDGEGIGFSDLKTFLYTGNPGILINWNAGKGNGLAEANALVHLDPVKTPIYDPACTEDDAGLFQCTLDIENDVPADATLVVTNADWPLCVDRTAMDPGASGIPALKACGSTTDNPGERFVMAANTLHAEFDQGGTSLSADQFVDKAGADMASCVGCHKDQEFHKDKGSFYHSVKEFVQCNSCHNATRSGYYPGRPADLKYNVHNYHSDGKHTPGAAHPATFPASKSNCENCHTKEQYDLPNQVNARPSVIADKYYSPTLVACAGCHLKSPLGNVNPSDPATGDEWAPHMKENGAVFGGTAEEATGREDCASCHAIGQDMGVDKVHNVFDFR